MGQPNSNRLRLVLSQLIERLRIPLAPGAIQPYPVLRNFLIDVLAEGRRKQIAHVLFEVDFSGIKERLTAHRFHSGEPVSITSYIAKSLACAISADKRMQAYRLGRSRLIVFEDIDFSFMVERDWEGEALPVFYILRAAQRKTAHEIHKELSAAKSAPLGARGPMSALELQFFSLPRVFRKIVWFFIRRNPYWFKSVAGTVGIASFGMHTSGAAVGLPITPMTLTLVIGSIEKKLSRENGDIVERDIIHLNLSVDHEIIDGAPLMRFVDRLKAILQQGTALDPSGPTQN